jgi:phosphatidylglycerol---prolipoprotein diacylglyceryl transferase
MHPDLFTINDFTIHSYNFFITLGLLFGSILFLYETKRRGHSFWTGMDIYLWAVVGTFVGGKFIYILLDFKKLPLIFSSPEIILSIGSTMLGALLGALFAVTIFCRLKGLDPWLLSDFYAPSIPLAQAFARIGCFCAGCCYGFPTKLPIGIVFTESNIAPLNIPLHPTQIYQMVLNFLIFLFLFFRRDRANFRGELILTYTFLYVIARNIVSIFRHSTHITGPFGAIPTSTIISAVVTIFAVFFYYKIRSKNKITNDPMEAKGR